MTNETRMYDTATPGTPVLPDAHAFRTAIDLCTPIGISLLDMEGRILFINVHFCMLVGCSSEELVGTLPPRSYWPPEERDTIEGALQDALAGRHPPDGVEVIFMRKNGERFPVQLLISPINDSTTGVPSGWVVSVLDITRRATAEAHLKRNHERLRLMVEVSQFKAGSIQELLDFSLERVVALSGSTIGYIYHYHEERREFVLNTWSREGMPACPITDPQTIRRLDETGVWGEVVRQRRPIVLNEYQTSHPLENGHSAGHSVLQRFMGIPVFDGDRIVAVVGVGNKPTPYDDADVEQLALLVSGVWSCVHKLDLETRLQTVRERFEFALSSGRLAIWEWSPVTSALEWSDSIDGMLGYERGQFPRTPTAWEAILHPDDRDRVLLALQRHLDEDAPYRIDYRVRKRSGEYVHWSGSAITFRDEQGKPLRMIGTCADITVRKQTEINLKQMQAQLIQQEKMASIGQLAAGVAHEINNPVGFIASNLTTLGKYHQRIETYLQVLEKALLERSGGVWPDAVAACRGALKVERIRDDLGDLLQESREGVERVKGIVADLKSFSRSDERRTTLVDLNRCVRTTLNIVRNEYKYVANLLLELQETLPPVRGNAQQLSQVIANLLVNAAHAIVGHGDVAVRTWHDGDDVLLTVSDTGSGIPPEHLEQIFDPFFTTKEVGKGTGLGLSICYDIVKKHGGRIAVESEPGCGTTFTVSLPVSSRELGENRE